MFYRTIPLTAGTAPFTVAILVHFVLLPSFSVDFIAGYSTDVFPLYNNTGCTVICSVQGTGCFDSAWGKWRRTELIIHRTMVLVAFQAVFFFYKPASGEKKTYSYMFWRLLIPLRRANLPGGIFWDLTICTCTPVLRNPSYIPLSRLAVCGSHTDDRKNCKIYQA